MAGEALDCFTSLLESIPVWIADLESTLKTATERQNAILLENRPAGPPLGDNTAKPALSRSCGSDHQDVRDVTPCASRPPTLLRPQLPHLSNSDALRLSQRKRKTVSACSDNQSGPSKFRARSMVVVYYDGDVQKRFETLVRAVGSCRNAIRKGKMAVKVDNLSRTDSSSSSDASNSGGEEPAFDLGKFGPNAGRPCRAKGNVFGREDGTEAFVKVDSLLEKAQALCERAAHQILRDGDCAVELKTATEHFTEARAVAESALPALRKKADRAAERQRRSDERHRAEEASELKRAYASVRTVTLSPSPPIDSQLEIDLEADDSSDRDDADLLEAHTLHFGRNQMRSSRIPAH